MMDKEVRTTDPTYNPPNHFEADYTMQFAAKCFAKAILQAYTSRKLAEL